MIKNPTCLAMGQPPLPIAIRWDFHFNADKNPRRPRECCLKQSTEGCAALLALKAALYTSERKVESLSVVLDKMAEEWEERFSRLPFRTRDQVRPWFFMALSHAQLGEIRLGRMTRGHEFVEVDPGELGTLYDLDAYRGGDR